MELKDFDKICCMNKVKQHWIKKMLNKPDSHVFGYAQCK